MTKTELKRFVMTKWAADGLTHKQVRELISGGASSSVLQKQADITSFFTKLLGTTAAAVGGGAGLVGNLLYKDIPTIAFGAPLIAGSLYYLATHPREYKEKLQKERIDQFNMAINKLKKPQEEREDGPELLPDLARRRAD